MKLLYFYFIAVTHKNFAEKYIHFCDCEINTCCECLRKARKYSEEEVIQKYFYLHNSSSVYAKVLLNLS